MKKRHQHTMYKCIFTLTCLLFTCFYVNNVGAMASRRPGRFAYMKKMMDAEGIKQTEFALHNAATNGDLKAVRYLANCSKESKP